MAQQSISINRNEGSAQAGHDRRVVIEGLLNAVNAHGSKELMPWSQSRLASLSPELLFSLHADTSEVLSKRRGMSGIVSDITKHMVSLVDHRNYTYKDKYNIIEEAGPFYHRRLIEAKLDATGLAYRGMIFKDAKALIKPLEKLAAGNYLRGIHRSHISLTANRSVAKAFTLVHKRSQYDNTYTEKDAMYSMGYDYSDCGSTERYYRSCSKDNPLGLLFTIDARKIDYAHATHREDNRTEEEILVERLNQAEILGIEVYKRNTLVADIKGPPNSDSLAFAKDVLVKNLLRLRA